jgi:hypothetical protein
VQQEKPDLVNQFMQEFLSQWRCLIKQIRQS